MANGKRLGCWILGLTISVTPFAGCAHGPVDSSRGLFSWFRDRPMTQREIERRERLEAAEGLEDPAYLHLKYAQWRENVGDLADARQSYQFALKQNPKSLEAKLGLARLDQLAGRLEEAEKGFRAALDSRPSDPLALNALGQFYASQKEWIKALPLLEQAADAAPHEIIFRYHLALAMAQSGDIQGAFPHFQQAVGEAEAHYNIGYLLYDKGHKELARQRFRKALALNPRLTQAQAMLDEMDPNKQQTQLAEAPAPRPTLSATPGPAAEAPLPPVQPVEHTVLAPEPSAWPALRPTSPRPNTPTSTPPAALPVTASPTPPATPPMTQVSVAPPMTQVPVAPPMTQVPVAPPAAVTEAPAPPVHNPPAFRPTRKQNWKQTEPPHHASEFLPPYRPEVDSAAGTNQSALTPPITPAQREQWKNQTKAVP